MNVFVLDFFFLLKTSFHSALWRFVLWNYIPISFCDRRISDLMIWTDFVCYHCRARIPTFVLSTSLQTWCNDNWTWYIYLLKCNWISSGNFQLGIKNEHSNWKCMNQKWIEYLKEKCKKLETLLTFKSFQTNSIKMLLASSN